jgi:hypothetical protein
MKRVLATTFGAVALFALPAAASDLGSMHASWPAAGTRGVQIDFPVGELDVIGTTGTQIEAVMSVRCKRGRNCEERAKKLEIITEIEGGKRRIEIKGHPKIDSDALQIRLQIHLPTALSVTVDMGVGDLDVREVAGDVEVDLGVGDADVRVAQKTVGSVECEVGVGDASVHSTGGNRRSSGLLGRTVRWEGNEGGSRVHLEVGVGEADVWLR